MANLGDKVFEYTRLTLEKLVDQFLRVRPFVSKYPPVNVEMILDRISDVKKVECVPLLAFNFKTEAMVLTPRFMHRDLTICVDQEIMNARDPAPYNMAVAEEIGHITLHRAVMLEIESQEDFADLQRHPMWYRAEHDAKYFGRALLMPRNMLELSG